MYSDLAGFDTLVKHIWLSGGMNGDHERDEEKELHMQIGSRKMVDYENKGLESAMRANYIVTCEISCACGVKHPAP